MDDFTLPTWLEKFRLNDELRSDAYENAISSHKGGIKSALALHFNIEKEKNTSFSKIEKNAFLLESIKKSCELSLYIVEKSFTSPAQFISCVLPALFAKAQVIIIFREIPSKSILLTLELMGLDQTFVFSANEDDKITVLYNELSVNFDEIPVILLGNNEKIENTFYDLGAKYQSYNYDQPTILVGEQEENFLAAYPKAKIINKFGENKSSATLDIASATAEDLDEIKQSILILGAGLEWYLPFVFSSEFFMNSRKTFTFSE